MKYIFFFLFISKSGFSWWKMSVLVTFWKFLHKLEWEHSLITVQEDRTCVLEIPLKKTYDLVLHWCKISKLFLQLANMGMSS